MKTEDKRQKVKGKSKKCPSHPTGRAEVRGIFAFCLYIPAALSQAILSFIISRIRLPNARFWSSVNRPVRFFLFSFSLIIINSSSYSKKKLRWYRTISNTRLASLCTYRLPSSLSPDISPMRLIRRDARYKPSVLRTSPLLRETFPLPHIARFVQRFCLCLP